MYGLYGFDEIIRNVYKVSHPMIGKGEVEDINDLQKYYLDFLEKYQPYVPVNRSEDKFISDDKIEAKLSASYSKSVLNDLNQEDIIGDSYTNEIKKKKIKLAKNALFELLSLDKNLEEVFNLVIHSIFTKEYKKGTNRKGFGGSSSASIGSIWISVDESATQLDLTELFLHELTHHLIFIDELNHAQFNYDEISKKENYAFSAILNMNRPLDKVVHSIIVGTELILWRKRFSKDNGIRIIHPSTEKMQRDIITACESVLDINDIENIIYPRTFEMIRKCITHSKSLVT